MSERVIDIATRRRSLIPHSLASATGADLLEALGNCEANDLIGALRFDTTPEDLATIQNFTSSLLQRTQDRLYGNGNQRNNTISGPERTS